MTVDLYDPLTYSNLMMRLIMRFEQQPRMPLASARDIKCIQGPGIYSVHYAGDGEIYKPISSSAKPIKPIYVGKAVPPGARKGIAPDASKPALRGRIADHRKSIEAAGNLEPADFSVRSLAVVPVWITLAERFLIDHYQPVWNLRLEGFGNHDPGSGRYQGQRSWWDTLHPGRAWASMQPTAKTRDEAAAMVGQFFQEQDLA